MIVPMDRADLPVASLVRTWLRVYTAGVSSNLRERRAQQIESDLWEHQADATARGAGRAALSLLIADRMARGIPADIAWRARIGGFAMNFSIPFNRTVGLLLLALVILVPVASSISGYDTSRAEWESELRRLGEQDRSMVNVTNIFQVLTGLALVGAGTAFALTMGQRSRVLGISTGVFLGIAGVLTLVSAALYAGFAELAHEFTSGDGDATTAATARALALTMDSTVVFATVCLAGGVFAASLAATRQAMLPRWLNIAPWVSAPLIVVYMFASVIDAWGDAAWTAGGVGFMFLVGWLIVAGGMLALRRAAVTPGAPQATPV